MTDKVLAVLRATADLGLALDALKGESETRVSALLCSDATQEFLTLPRPSDARAVFAKHLRYARNDWPALADSVNELIASLE